MKIVTPLGELTVTPGSHVKIDSNGVHVMAEHDPNKRLAHIAATSQVAVLPGGNVGALISAINGMLMSRSGSENYGAAHELKALKRTLRRYDANRGRWVA